MDSFFTIVVYIDGRSDDVLFLGDTICIMSKNCHNFVVSLVGCSLAHVTISPANPAYTGKELLYQLEVSQSNSIIIGRELIGALEDALKIAQVS